MMRDIVTKRMGEEGGKHGDLLDHIIADKSTDSFIDDDFIVQLMFGLFFVTSDSISTTLALAFKLLADHPLVLEELTVSIVIYSSKEEKEKKRD